MKNGELKSLTLEEVFLQGISEGASSIENRITIIEWGRMFHYLCLEVLWECRPDWDSGG